MWCALIFEDKLCLRECSFLTTNKVQVTSLEPAVSGTSKPEPWALEFYCSSVLCVPSDLSVILEKMNIDNC
jgi:hypothetical protein